VACDTEEIAAQHGIDDMLMDKRGEFALAGHIDFGYILGYTNDKPHQTIGGVSLWGAIKMERETGLEPATTCLGSRCATNCATPARQ
jgi:hypothetical protein